MSPDSAEERQVLMIVRQSVEMVICRQAGFTSLALAERNEIPSRMQAVVISL
jgi:hypothetical protein